MRVLIHGGDVITGDGSTLLRQGSVHIVDGRVESVDAATALPSQFDGKVIDARGHVVMPGLVNMHTHGVSPAPLFPSADRSLDSDQWLNHLDRHLLTGTTTVLSLCGFGTMDQIREADAQHAVNVRGATTHTPASLVAAERAGGAGLTESSRLMTAEKMVEDGALAIGELAGGQTLGGGGQDLVYIPSAVERATGVRITQRQSRELKEAVLGRFLDSTIADRGRFLNAMDSAGLSSTIAPAELETLIRTTVMSSVGSAIDGIREGVRIASRLGVPAIVHSAAASAQVMRELMRDASGATVIAAHVNHPSHTPDEAVALAREGASFGWHGEVCVFDLVETREMVPVRDHWDAVLSEPGLVSLIATDYGHNGAHDSLMAGVLDVSERGHRTLPEAVAMAGSAVAELIPGICEGNATLRRGAPADIVIARRSSLTDIRDVLVAGERVVLNGALTNRARR